MKPIEILEKIVQELSVQNSNKSILIVYREAFNSSDDIELFKLRALLMKQMESSLEHTSKSNNILQTFNEICKGLTYYNLAENIKSIAPFITNAHLTSVEAIFMLQNFKQDFDAVDEIEKLNDELKDIIETEEITSEQKEIILEVCSDVDTAIFEHKITGNNAIKKLHESILMKLTFHENIIKSIKSIEIKNKFIAVCSKVESINKVMNTVTSLASKAKDIIELLSSGTL
jgi:uncharacterized Zn finger protein